MQALWNKKGCLLRSLASKMPAISSTSRAPRPMSTIIPTRFRTMCILPPDTHAPCGRYPAGRRGKRGGRGYRPEAVGDEVDGEKHRLPPLRPHLSQRRGFRVGQRTRAWHDAQRDALDAEDVVVAGLLLVAEGGVVVAPLQRCAGLAHEWHGERPWALPEVLPPDRTLREAEAPLLRRPLSPTGAASQSQTRLARHSVRVTHRRFALSGGHGREQVPVALAPAIVRREARGRLLGVGHDDVGGQPGV